MWKAATVPPVQLDATEACQEAEKYSEAHSPVAEMPLLGRGSESCTWRWWDTGGIAENTQRSPRVSPVVLQVVTVNKKQWPSAMQSIAGLLAAISVEFSSALPPVCSSFAGCPCHCSVLRWWLSCQVKSSQPDREADQVLPASSQPGNICSSRESTFLYALQRLIDRPVRKCNL